jgi:hypothetical protein
MRKFKFPHPKDKTMQEAKWNITLNYACPGPKIGANDHINFIQ